MVYDDFILVMANGDEVPIADQGAFVDFLNTPGNFPQIKCAVFPFTVTVLDTGRNRNSELARRNKHPC